MAGLAPALMSRPASRPLALPDEWGYGLPDPAGLNPASGLKGFQNFGILPTTEKALMGVSPSLFGFKAGPAESSSLTISVFLNKGSEIGGIPRTGNRLFRSILIRILAIFSPREGSNFSARVCSGVAFMIGFWKRPPDSKAFEPFQNPEGSRPVQGFLPNPFRFRLNRFKI